MPPEVNGVFVGQGDGRQSIVKKACGKAEDNQIKRQANQKL
jgi:hypothetical protein